MYVLIKKLCPFHVLHNFTNFQTDMKENFIVSDNFGNKNCELNSISV